MNSSTIDNPQMSDATSDNAELSHLRAAVHGHPLLATFCDAIPQPLVILNAGRAIVMANRPFLEMVGIDGVEDLVGKRHGEAVGCRVAQRAPGGCGTAEGCQSCGAARAIAAASVGKNQKLACIVDREGECVPFELEASARAFDLDGEPLVLLVLVDVRDRHRRRILERLFFEDVLKSATGLVGLTEVLSASAPAEMEELAQALASQGRRLVEEIRGQRDLTAAESGELIVDWQKVHATRVVNEVRDAYRHHPVSNGRIVGMIPGPDVTLVSDSALVLRVLGHLLKNALEACPPGGTVTLAHEVEDGQVVFRVWNPGEVPAEARRHMFRRVFSTKDDRRGLGAYSIRILVEANLGGRVGFASDPEGGTNFHVCLPLDGPGALS